MKFKKKDITKVHPDIIKFSKESIQIFKNEIDLFDKIKIEFVDSFNDDTLGIFKSGTSSSTPTIILSEKDILETSKEDNIPLWTIVETTIFHELGHAICELERIVFGYKYLEYTIEEEWVENFAYELHLFHLIPQDLKTFIHEYKKIKNN